MKIFINILNNLVHWLLPTANCPLRTAHCLLKTATCLLRTAHCRLRTANCRLRTANCLLPTANCPLRIAHCLLKTATCLLLYCQLATAQVYPVQVNTQLIPPYTLKLSDYATTMSEKLIVQALMIDVNETSRQLRFRLTIKGNGLQIRSNDFVVGVAPIFIDGGVPLRLSNLDLRPYFELQNLNGITPQQYNSPLPDGNYQFCFEVFDWVSGQRLSSSKLGCFNAFLIINDPPFLNLPRRGDLVESKNPQNILFNWTPRHLNANGVQYEFELREVWDTQIDPQAAFLASPNLYSTTTFNTTLLYGPGETTLLENKTYAWRVRAVVTDGISKASIFRNNGYSEIYYFTYTADCQSPQFALAKSLSVSSEEITWLPNPDHLKYRVQYRKKGVRDAVWFEANAINPYTTLYNLESGTTYEYRVGGQCTQTVAGTESRFSYNAVQEFTTPTKTEDSYYNCGIAPEVTITNREPLDNIGANEVFTAGDFPVTIKQVDGGNGTFSGLGYIVVPYLADTKIAVEFNNIRINTDYQLYQGSLYTTYDANWGNVDDIQDEIDAVAEIPKALGDLAQVITEMLNLDIDKATREQIKNLTDAFVDGVQSEDLPEELSNSLEEAANNYESSALAVKDAEDQLTAAQESGDEQAIKEAEENLSTAQNNFNTAQNNLNEVNKEREGYLKQFSDIIKKAITEIYREYKDMDLEGQYVSQLDNFMVIEPNTESPVENESEGIIVLDVEILDTNVPNNKAMEDYENTLRSLGIYYICKLVIEDQEGTYYDKFIEMAKNNGNDLFKTVKTMLEEGKVEREIIPVIKEKIISATSKILEYNG